MTDYQINVAIARACECQCVPNYCYDLNAMHEVENGLDYFDGTRGRYLGELTTIVAKANDELPPSKCRGTYRATARQRAEAFLRVKGLWT